MTTYVVYEVGTTKLVLGRHGKRTYATERAAKAALTRAGRTNKAMMATARTGEYYASIESTVERTNLMSGKKFRESVNTPWTSSPASETYWSS